MWFLCCCSISFFVSLHFLYTQARKWDVQVCVIQEYSHPIHIALNRDINASITCSNKENCFSTEFELVNKTQPQYIFIRPSLAFKVIVQSHDLQEGYGVLCQESCPRSYLRKWTHWSIEVKLNKAYGNDEYSFEIEPSVKTNVVFRPNSKTSNKSFFLPMEMNETSRIKLLTKGKFWLDTDIKLKNMETSEIYSCIYLHDQFTQTSYHECSSANASVWKIELTSRPKLIRSITEINVFLGVPGSETDSLHNLTLRKLAYLPTFADFTNIGNIRTSEAEIHFSDTNKAFDIFKIVVTRVLTGEEYGCANLHKTIPAKYSCRLLQSKNWQLRIISPEEHEQTFFVEIIQDTLSFFSRSLIWRNLCKHGFDIVDNFNLKMYGDNEITGLKLHFLDKPLRINDISLRNDHSEYKFKATKESKIENRFVTEFIPITKEKIHPDKTVRNMKIVIGLFVVNILLLIIIIIIILCIRYKMLRKSFNKGYTSTLQDTGTRKDYIPMQNANITRPCTQLGSQLQSPEDVFGNTDPMSGRSAGVCDSSVYEDLH